MHRISDPAALKPLVGQELGLSDWLMVDQARIDGFARVTGDDQWIHVDVERAKGEMPGGRTIAHGYLTLSLIPILARQILMFEHGRRVNYGLNRVRFTSTVPSGARIRLRMKLVAADDVPDSGIRLTFESTMELEGGARPALVAEHMTIAYPPRAAS
ncbi:MAG: MaoC family dehydratase [Alphaproteobacteria bacterium]|nr:MaoC family dehydratase [Alphaproteobacteria bacterium]